jgi:hypothetical protein
MISQFALLVLWLNPQAKTIDLSSYIPVPLGKPVNHLKSFIETRNLTPGEAIFRNPIDMIPSLQKPPAPMLGIIEIGSALPPILLPKPANVASPLQATAMVAPILPGIVPSSPNVLPLPIAPETKIVTPMPQAPTVEKPKKIVAIVPKQAPMQGSVEERPKHVVMAAEAEAPAVKPKPSVEDTPVTLAIMNGKLDVVISELMAQTHTNLLLLTDSKTPSVVPAYNVRNRKFRFVLADICAMAGLSYLKVEDEYIIATDDKLKSAYPTEYSTAHPDKPAEAVKAQAESEVVAYHTNYADANKLVTALSKAYHPEGLTMIIAPEGVTPQLDSGATGSSTTGAQQSNVLQKDSEVTKVSRTILLHGPKDVVDATLAILKQLDVQPAQVSLQVEIHDISVTAANQLGIQWTMPSTTFNENQGNGISFGSFSRTPLSFSATLNALENDGVDKLLARPNISVDDGQRAYVLVGDRLQFPVLSGYSQTGQAIYTVDEERVGIYLQVSVWVTNDGKVKMDLYPQVSTVTGFNNVGGAQYPQISTRESQTVVTVENGKTLVIAGLLQDEDITNIQKVPILGSIPILKELFSYRQKTHNKNEVIITITPTITSK